MDQNIQNIKRKTSTGAFDADTRNKYANLPPAPKRNAATNPVTKENSDHVISPPQDLIKSQQQPFVKSDSRQMIENQLCAEPQILGQSGNNPNFKQLQVKKASQGHLTPYSSVIIENGMRQFMEGNQQQQSRTQDNSQQNNDSNHGNLMDGNQFADRYNYSIDYQHDRNRVIDQSRQRKQALLQQLDSRLHNLHQVSANEKPPEDNQQARSLSNYYNQAHLQNHFPPRQTKFQSQKLELNINEIKDNIQHPSTIQNTRGGLAYKDKQDIFPSITEPMVKNSMQNQTLNRLNKLKQLEQTSQLNQPICLISDNTNRFSMLDSQHVSIQDNKHISQYFDKRNKCSSVRYNVGAKTQQSIMSKDTIMSQLKTSDISHNGQSQSHSINNQGHSSTSNINAALRLNVEDPRLNSQPGTESVPPGGSNTNAAILKPAALFNHGLQIKGHQFNGPVLAKPQEYQTEQVKANYRASLAPTTQQAQVPNQNSGPADFPQPPPLPPQVPLTLDQKYLSVQLLRQQQQKRTGASLSTRKVAYNPIDTNSINSNKNLSVSQFAAQSTVIAQNALLNRAPVQHPRLVADPNVQLTEPPSKKLLQTQAGTWTSIHSEKGEHDKKQVEGERPINESKFCYYQDVQSLKPHKQNSQYEKSVGADTRSQQQQIPTVTCATAQQQSFMKYLTHQNPPQLKQEQQPLPSTSAAVPTSLHGQKPYDYLFITISNQQFQDEYSHRILINNGKHLFMKQKGEQQQSTLNDIRRRRNKNDPALAGLVNIKGYQQQNIVFETPQITCNLFTTHLDHLKVLICHEEEYDVSNPPVLPVELEKKLEQDKQTQIQEFMYNIIQKLNKNQRRYKTTIDNKLIDEALQLPSHLRMASVYVIVINRQNHYDPVISSNVYANSNVPAGGAPRYRNRKSKLEDGDKKMVDLYQSSSEEDIRDRLEQKKQEMMTNRIQLENINGDQQVVGNRMQIQQTNVTNQPPANAMQVTQNADSKPNIQTTKPWPMKPFIKRSMKPEDYKFKWVPTVKTFPAKYGATKIRIIQNLEAHAHMNNHKLSIFFAQYNEFVRLVFKHQRATSETVKVNINYVIGLGKCLGIKVSKDLFSESNMKSRDGINQLKEKLVQQVSKKMMAENQDIVPTPIDEKSLPKSPRKKKLDDIETEQTENPQNKTPKEQKQESVRATNQAKKETSPFQPEKPQANTARGEVGSQFRFFIGYGNNATMVKSLFKNRYWWTNYDKNEMDKVNFMWTQIKNVTIMDSLLCKYPNRKAGIKNETTDNEENTNEDPSNKHNHQKLYNKIEDNFHIANKKALLLNMRNYYDALEENVFDNLPVTFHIKNGTDDPEFQKFKRYYDKTDEEIQMRKLEKARVKHDKTEESASPTQEQRGNLLGEVDNSQSKDHEGEAALQPSPPNTEFFQSNTAVKNIWIVKPGENTNCGNGIQVARNFNEIISIVAEADRNNKKRTCIVQQYIHNPLLIHRRKFDIRTYSMLTSIAGNMKGYFYEEGYIRTSSYEFDIYNLSDRLIHLTNDAVQKRDKNYGKYEPGNKMSYNEFQNYLDRYHSELSICFDRDLLPQIKKLTTDIFRAAHMKLDPKRRVNTFEVFGLDFMIDDEFKLYLIEVNTNPCLELSAPLLARMIPNMLENALKLAVDPLFPPPENFSSKKAFVGDPCPENKFELVFDDKIDGPVIEELLKAKDQHAIEMDEDDLSDEEEHPDSPEQTEHFQQQAQ